MIISISGGFIMNLDTFIGSLKKYAVFTGRLSLREFVNFILWYLIIAFAVGFFEGLFLSEYVLVTGQSMIGNIYTIALILPLISLEIRRMHDVGKLGWFSFIPIYNLVLVFTKDDEKENQYGSNPEATNNR